jgi:hypothetical protein
MERKFPQEDIHTGVEVQAGQVPLQIHWSEKLPLQGIILTPQVAQVPHKATSFFQSLGPNWR